MRKLVPFLACLMLVLATWTGIAHATEVGGCVEIGQYELSAHVDGDADQVPADAAKDYPHHHAPCHAHDMNPSSVSAIAALGVSTSGSKPIVRDERGAGYDAEAALRPPQA